jgi:hypothetical protein
MSFLDDILGDVGGFFKSTFGDSAGLIGGLLSTALTGFALKKVNDSVTKENETKTTTTTTEAATTSAITSSVSDSAGVRLQVAPNVDQRVPVLYGSAFFGGIVTEAVSSSDNQTMYYVLTLCEKTGTKISDDLPSQFTFKDVYLNDNRVVFYPDGYTVNYTLDRDNNFDRNYDGLIKIYAYDGGSTNTVNFEDYSNPALPTASQVIPTWTTAHSMTNLVFAIVSITYNSERGVTGLPTVTFNIENSMTMPGDCLYDYMTNTRYGAGIAAGEIFVQ